MRVRSELGQGTVFKMIFPASSEKLELAPAPKTAIKRDEMSPGAGMVLAIDDEISVCETVADMLDMSGYKVITAFSGKQGIELFQTHQHEIKVILLDLTMPGLSGEETYKRLRDLDGNIQIVVSSGHSQTQMSATFAGEPNIGFLPKPYNFQELERVVSACLQPAVV